jgi:putative alpha-1,2-mannosidase
MGGSSAAVARLDRHFQQLNAGPCSEFAFMGNEVSLKTPWMYAFAGAPWKTQNQRTRPRQSVDTLESDRKRRRD